MQSLVITPKTKAQFKLLADLLAEMNIKATLLVFANLRKF